VVNGAVEAVGNRLNLSLWILTSECDLNLKAITAATTGKSSSARGSAFVSAAAVPNVINGVAYVD
jgi:hypothetical protein